MYGLYIHYTDIVIVILLLNHLFKLLYIILGLDHEDCVNTENVLANRDSSTDLIRGRVLREQLVRRLQQH